MKRSWGVAALSALACAVGLLSARADDAKITADNWGEMVGFKPDQYAAALG